jgi:catechol 2,3-dioxygenase-like lactoylglutathione lyase family enzyme
MQPSAFLGLRTVVYQVTDLARARAWYRDLLGIEPYFDQPFYVGFNMGGFELGLDPDASTHRAGAGGSVAYWGVADLEQAWPRALGLGAESVSAPQSVGGDIRVALAKDPFGNLIGLIENPGFPNTA